MNNVEMYNRLVAAEARLERQTTILETVSRAINMQADLIVALHTADAAFIHQVEVLEADIAKAREWADRVNRNIGNIDARVGQLEGL